MTAAYVIWRLEEACPDWHGTLTADRLEDGSTGPGVPVVRLRRGRAVTVPAGGDGR